MEEKEYQELIGPYRECLGNVENRLKILAEDYRERYGEEPIHHMQSRIKTRESIEGKLLKKGWGQTAEDARYYLRDIAGVRVICYDLEGIRKLARALKRQGDLELVKEKDYIAHPKPNGYKSYHMVVTIPVYLTDGPVETKVEIQIRTVAMDFWASLEHKIAYKLEGNPPVKLLQELKACADMVDILDAKMFSLNEAISEIVKAQQEEAEKET